MSQQTIFFYLDDPRAQGTNIYKAAGTDLRQFHRLDADAAGTPETQGRDSLLELPANFSKNTEREAFLRMLPRGRYAFEFYDNGWYSDDFYTLLHKRNVALCISDHHDSRRLAASAAEVFVYFDNDRKAAAPQDALRLLNFLRD